jgi:hypothetical protein
MMFLLVGLLVSPAHAEDIERGPSGTIVTVRPEVEKNEMAWILDGNNLPLPLPDDLPKPMWLVHPEAWRQAVALAEKYAIEKKLPDEQADIIKNLEADRDNEKRMRSELRINYEALESMHETETKMLRRSRTHWAIGFGVGGAIIGGGGAFLILR